MRKGLAILAVFSLVSVAPADVVQMFYPTRDSGINQVIGWEEYTNMGAITQCLIRRYRQHFLLMDYDWPAIKALVDGFPGWTATYELSMVPAFDTMDGTAARLVMSSNDVDWVEGDGAGQYTNFNWTDPTVNPAVTSQYAQTYEDPLTPGSPDPARCIGPWPGGSFDAFRATSGYYDSGGITFSTAGVRVFEILDPWFMDQILTGHDPQGYPIRGIYTYDKDSLSCNSEAYTSNAGQGLSPYIRVTLVPEPSSALVLALGICAMLRRRSAQVIRRRRGA